MVRRVCVNVKKVVRLLSKAQGLVDTGLSVSDESTRVLPVCTCVHATNRLEIWVVTCAALHGSKVK